MRHPNPWDNQDDNLWDKQDGKLRNSPLPFDSFRDLSKWIQ